MGHHVSNCEAFCGKYQPILPTILDQFHGSPLPNNTGKHGRDRKVQDKRKTPPSAVTGGTGGLGGYGQDGGAVKPRTQKFLFSGTCSFQNHPIGRRGARDQSAPFEPSPGRKPMAQPTS